MSAPRRLQLETKVQSYLVSAFLECGYNLLALCNTRICHGQPACNLQKEKNKGQKGPPKNWKVLKERHQQIKQKLKKQADDWMRN